MAKYGKMQNPEGTGGESKENPAGHGNLCSGSVHSHTVGHDGKDQFADFAGGELGWKGGYEGGSVGKGKHSAHDKATGFIKR